MAAGPESMLRCGPVDDTWRKGQETAGLFERKEVPSSFRDGNDRIRMSSKENLQEESAREEKDLSVEEAFEKLDGMIEILSDRDTPLEKAFETYQEAVKLLKKCSGQIDLVEKKVMMLNEEGGLDEL